MSCRHKHYIKPLVTERVKRNQHGLLRSTPSQPECYAHPPLSDTKTHSQCFIQFARPIDATSISFWTPKGLLTSPWTRAVYVRRQPSNWGPKVPRRGFGLGLQHGTRNLKPCQALLKVFVRTSKSSTFAYMPKGPMVELEAGATWLWAFCTHSAAKTSMGYLTEYQLRVTQDVRSVDGQSQSKAGRALLSFEVASVVQGFSHQKNRTRAQQPCLCPICTQ